MKKNKRFMDNFIIPCYFRFPKAIPRGQGNEAKRVNARLEGFDYENSTAFKKLTEKFSSSVTHCELKSIANIICKFTGLKLDRDATRDNRVLIKWFDENWDVIGQNILKVTLLDEDEKLIDSSRDSKE